MQLENFHSKWNLRRGFSVKKKTAQNKRWALHGICGNTFMHFGCKNAFFVTRINSLDANLDELALQVAAFSISFARPSKE